jgi:RNA polymerase sigma factor (TIGR02999 family)
LSRNRIFFANVPTESDDLPREKSPMLPPKASMMAADLFPLVYDELRNIARERMLKVEPGQTLQPTALVHEAWLKVSSEEGRTWNDRTHFFRTAAQAMRQILVDRARAKAAVKRTVTPQEWDLHGLNLADTSLDERVLLVNEMMLRIEQDDPELVRLVTLKFFGGMTNKEIAAIDGVTERTVERHWAYARALLYQMMREETGHEPASAD